MGMVAERGQKAYPDIRAFFPFSRPGGYACLFSSRSWSYCVWERTRCKWGFLVIPVLPS